MFYILHIWSSTRRPQAKCVYTTLAAGQLRPQADSSGSSKHITIYCNSIFAQKLHFFSRKCRKTRVFLHFWRKQRRTRRGPRNCKKLQLFWENVQKTRVLSVFLPFQRRIAAAVWVLIKCTKIGIFLRKTHFYARFKRFSLKIAQNRQVLLEFTGHNVVAHKVAQKLHFFSTFCK